MASSSPSDDDAYCCVRQIANLPATQSSSPLQSNCNLFCLGGVLNHNEYFIPSKVGGYKEQYLKGGTDFQKSPRWWHPLKLDLGHHLGDWCKKQIERTTPILPGGGKNWWLQYGSKGLDPVEWWDDGFQLASTGVANKKTWVPKNSDIAYTKKAFCQFPQWKHRNRKCLPRPDITVIVLRAGEDIFFCGWISRVVFKVMNHYLPTLKET